MEPGAFGEELRLRIRRALKAAEVSFDVRDQDPLLASLVQMMLSNPSRLGEADQMLADLVPRLGRDPDPAGLVELLSYCVHTLDLPLVLAQLKAARTEAQAKLAGGESLRPWDHVRRCEHVLMAADSEWEDREMFPSLAE